MDGASFWQNGHAKTTFLRVVVLYDFPLKRNTVIPLSSDVCPNSDDETRVRISSTETAVLASSSRAQMALSPNGAPLPHRDLSWPGPRIFHHRALSKGAKATTQEAQVAKQMGLLRFRMGQGDSFYVSEGNKGPSKGPTSILWIQLLMAQTHLHIF